MADKEVSDKQNSAISLPDEKLIQLILESRNSEMYGILYDRYAQKVYQRCLKFVDQKEEAQDLTHDLFIKVYYSLSKFQFKSSFSTWLYAVTYNHCVEYLSQKKKLKIQKEDDYLEIAEDFGYKDIEDSEFLALKSERLNMALERVPATDRMILFMKYLDESSINDISAVLQLSESAVKMRIKRAKARVLEVYNQLGN